MCVEVASTHVEEALIVRVAPKLTQQPEFCHPPIALHCIPRHVESFGGFIDIEPAEKPHLDHLTLARIHRGQRRQRLIESDQIVAGFARNHQRFIERQHGGATAALLVVARACRVDEDASHHPRCHRKKVRPVLPLHLLDFDEPQIRLVDERGRLKCVIGPLPVHVMPGYAAQFLVDQR